MLMLAVVKAKRQFHHFLHIIPIEINRNVERHQMLMESILGRDPLKFWSFE